MERSIIFLRGINVGGKHLLPMARLRQVLADLGCANVRTYIQSGNAVVDSTLTDHQLESDLRDTIGQEFGFRPLVHVLSVTSLEDIVAANPWPQATSDPARLHVWFLSRNTPNLDATTLTVAPDEHVRCEPSAVYLWAPRGIGKSKFPEQIERKTAKSATARNWRTIKSVLGMALES